MTLVLDSISVRYGTGSNALVAVDGVSLRIAQGTTVGLVGETGCGKSTVARAIVGIAPISAGRVLVDGDDATDRKVRNARQFRRRVQMIFQNPYASLNPRLTVGATLADALRTAGTTRRVDRDRESRRLLDLVGLPTSAADQYPHQFSGGQRQRISIARALAVSPELIIHDEVTSALDVSVQASILNLLKDLQREFSLSYLFISHDLSTVRYMSETVAVMYLGRVVENAPVHEVFTAPLHPYTRALFESVPRFGKAWRSVPLAGDPPDPRHPPSGCRFRPRCPVGPLFDPSRTICAEVDPQEGANSRPHLAACHFAGTPAVVEPADPQDLAPTQLGVTTPTPAPTSTVAP